MKLLRKIKSFLEEHSKDEVQLKDSDIGEEDCCPHCQKKLNPVPKRKKKCPFCEKFMYSRTRPSDRKKVLVTEEEKDKIEEQWAILSEDSEERLSELKEYKDAKQELKAKFGKDPPPHDVQWNLCNKKIIEYAVKKQWGLFRNNKFEMASLLKKEGRDKQALQTLFEVCYLDLNGCRNVGTIDNKHISKEYMEKLGVKEFDPFLAFLALGVLGMVKEIIEKLGISKEEGERIFIEINEKAKPLRNMPVSCEKAWDRLKEKIWIDKTKKISWSEAERMKSKGIKKVEWMASLGDRTCKECKKRDGKVFKLEDVMYEIHEGCRCTLVEANSK